MHYLQLFFHHAGSITGGDKGASSWLGSVFLQLTVERRLSDAQEFCGPQLVAVELLDGAENTLFLQFGKRKNVVLAIVSLRRRLDLSVVDHGGKIGHVQHWA